MRNSILLFLHGIIIYSSVILKVTCSATVKYTAETWNFVDGDILGGKDRIVNTRTDVQFLCKLKAENTGGNALQWDESKSKFDDTYFEVSLYYMKDEADDKNEIMRMIYKCKSQTNTNDNSTIEFCSTRLIHLTKDSPIKSENFKATFDWSSEVKAIVLRIYMTITDIQQNQDGYYECNNYLTEFDTNALVNIDDRPTPDDIQLKKMIQLIVQALPRITELLVESDYVENDTVLVICTFTAGNPEGDVIISSGGQTLKSYALPDVRKQQTNKKVQAASFIAERKHDGKIIKCLVKNKIGIDSREQELKVLHRPANVIHSPYQFIFKRNEKIDCTAVGNPEPKYKWERLEDSAGALEFQDKMQGLNIPRNAPYGWYHYKCIASNVIRDQKFESYHTIKILIAPKEISNSSKIPLLVTLIVITLAWALLWRRFKV